MVKINKWKLFLIFFEIFVGISASTHWIVTETGRIQSHLDSPFHLRRPYDLLALLDQEKRLSTIDVLYKDLVSRKTFIDKKWSGLEGASDLESRIYSHDPDCLKAGKLLSDIDLYTSIAADGSDRDGIKLIDFLIEDHVPDGSLVPDCKNAVDLDFSMFVFEHLSAMVNRQNISISPEKALEQWLQPGTTVATFGHQVALGLIRNNTSWLHHNLGAIYWRIKGIAYNAVECGRRAVHFAPREYRDIALLNLASIFHQARHPGEAAIILHAAVDHAPHQPANHFALGNVYAALADYNRSVACYDNFLRLRPGLPEAVTTKHATLCHKKLETGLMELHDSLQEILSELHDYHSQQEQWLRLQERLMWEQAPLEAKLVSYTPEAFSAMLANRGQTCTQRTSEDNKPILSCDLNTDTQLMAHNLHIDITLSLQMLLRNVESQAQKISEQMSRGKLDDKKRKWLEHKKIGRGEEDVLEPPTLDAKYPASMDVPMSSEDFDDSGWPSRQQCGQWKLDFNNNKVFPVFLPPENKGFEMNKILSDSIGLPPGSEHELPWYPPICQNNGDEPLKALNKKYFPQNILKQSMNVKLESNSYLNSQLLNYVNQGKANEAEIGQRIITAIQKKAGPNWLLSTLASLYWRIRGNTRNTLECLNVAIQTVPEDYRDVVLVSLSSVLHQLGYIDEALKIALEAFSHNKIEPSTNFLIAQLYNLKDNTLIASYHLKHAIKVDPNYYNRELEVMLKTFACKLKLNVPPESVTKPEIKDGMCAEKDGMNTDGVICSAGNGESFKTAAIQCYQTESIPDDADLSSISKLLSGNHCTRKRIGLGHSLITTLLAANGGDGSSEGSGNIEPDQSQLESIAESQQHAYHMRISLSDDNVLGKEGASTLGDFYVSVSLTDEPTPEAMLYVYDKSGTYPLSPKGCRAIRDADWLHFSSMWQSIATRNMDIGTLLKPLPTGQEPLKPHCDSTLPPSPLTLDHLTSMRLRHHRLGLSPEPALADWLGLMTGDHLASVRDIATRIALTLQENTTSWILATAAAIYWRTVGYTDEAVTCLRQALTYAPNDVRDIPLVNLANVLHRVGFHSDALEVAYMALDNRPNFVVNHFTVGNIHTSLGDLEKAISFYRSSLALDANFEPARNRLQAILCTLLFDETGTLRDTDSITDN